MLPKYSSAEDFSMVSSEIKGSKKRVVLTPLARYILKTVKKRMPISEIINLYAVKHTKKPSRRTFQRAVAELVKQKKLNKECHEQLWLSPMNPTSEPMSKPMHGRKLTPPHHRIHSSHKIKLSMPYSGQQPQEDATEVRPFGRYKTAVQSIYKKYLGQSITIVAFKDKLNVWFHFPKGVRTTEQMINAKKESYLALMEFAKEHNLKLDGYLDKVIQSHHVVEDMPTNAILKPLFKEYGKEIKERIGSAICQTSHPGKIEHEGVKRLDGVIVKGEKIANGLEYLCYDFPEHFGMLAKQQNRYNENIEKHLAVLEEISVATKELRDTMKAIRKELGK